MVSEAFDQGQSMAEPKEVALTAAAARRVSRVEASAAALREGAQLEYDEAVAAQAAAISSHIETLNALDRATSQDISAAASQTLATMRQSAVASHFAALAEINERIADLQPQLDVSFWLETAESLIVAEEANGR